MTYFVIENFGHGLDARRHILNLPPGALYRAKNCNLNRGGEAESAKAFVSKGGFPINTFGLMAAGGKLWTFGNNGYTDADMPGGVKYQQLLHPAGGYMTGVVWATAIKGKPFVIATYNVGRAVFFNGQLITDWLPGASGIATYADVAVNFAQQINDYSAAYSAVAAGNVVTITGRSGTPFSVAATATNGGAVDDQTMTVANVQNAAAGGGEVLATGSITFTGLQPTYDPDFGHWNSTPYISTLTIGGVEQLGRQLVGTDDPGAASALAGNCNLFSAVPDYGASVSGSTTTFTALAGSGASANGLVIAHDSAYAPYGVMAGGVAAGSSVPQITTITFGGTYEATDHYSISLDGVPFSVSQNGIGATPAAGQPISAAVTKNGKTYAVAGPNLFGSAIGNCMQWNSGTGSFVLDMSNEVAGAELLIGLGIFQNNLAVFSRNTVQMRFVDPDPANDETLQVMQNIGTMAPKTIIPFGDSDLFFLSDTGLRSLKVRSATNAATLSDIGSPIDPLVIAAIKAAGSNIGIAPATMEPVDGRFMLQIGTTTYVFNFFPDAKVAAWTTYESGLAISEFAVLEQRLYARTPNIPGDNGQLYLLGGNNNDTYSAQAMDVKLPFLSARQLATLKHFTALDVVCDGTFDVFISTDPLAPDNEEVALTVGGSTPGVGAVPFAGEDVTAIALRFRGRPSAYGRVSTVAVHYEPLGENAP